MVNDRLAGAVVEFLEAKSRNAASGLVGEGFRKLSERWGLSPVDWESPAGSIARALVEDREAERLSREVADLLVAEHVARVGSLDGAARRDAERESARFVDWLERFTPFRFVEAWGRAGGPSAEWWSAWVEAVVEDAREIPANLAPDDGGEKVSDLLRHASGEANHSFAREGARARIAVLMRFAPLEVVQELLFRASQSSIAFEIVDSPRLGDSPTIAGLLMAAHPRLRACAVVLLERSQGLLPEVAFEVARLLGAVPRADWARHASRLTEALTWGRGGLLARFAAALAACGAGIDDALVAGVDGLSRPPTGVTSGDGAEVGDDRSRGGDTSPAALAERVYAMGTRNPASLSTWLSSQFDGSAASPQGHAQIASQGRRLDIARALVRLAARNGDRAIAAAVAEAAHPHWRLTANPWPVPRNAAEWVADELRRAGTATAAVASTAAPGVAPAATPGATADLPAQGRAVVVRTVRSRIVDLLLLFSGIEIWRFLFFAPLWFLGYRRSGTVNIDATTVRFSGSTSFLGREVRAYEHTLPAAALRAFSVRMAWRILYLVVGVVAIAVFTLFGVSFIFDGVARSHAGIITFGALFVVAGLVIDGSCYLLFLRGGQRVFLTARFDGPVKAVRAWVDRRDADRVVSAIGAVIGGSAKSGGARGERVPSKSCK